MIEADPVDAGDRAPRIAVAQLDAPLWRMLSFHIVRRCRHGAALRSHAALLPVAIDADVERKRIAQRRQSLKLVGCGQSQSEEQGAF